VAPTHLPFPFPAATRFRGRTAGNRPGRCGGPGDAAGNRPAGPLVITGKDGTSWPGCPAMTLLARANAEDTVFCQTLPIRWRSVLLDP
jgi:hypothetical protein